MLILNTSLSYDDLKVLSEINDNTDNINILKCVEQNNLIISYDSKIIEIENNFMIVEAQLKFIDLFLGFVSDLPIKKIDIMNKLNEQYTFISTVIPEIQYVDIISEPNPELAVIITLNNTYNTEKIEKVNTKIYKLTNTLLRNPYLHTYYKIYFDENINIKNNILKDVGIFIHDTKLRSFVMSHCIYDMP